VHSRPIKEEETSAKVSIALIIHSCNTQNRPGATPPVSHRVEQAVSSGKGEDTEDEFPN
jgi:hypothetical protein